MKTCPFCAEEIQDAAIVCKHCHRDLPAPVSAGRSAKSGGWLPKLLLVLGIVLVLGYLVRLIPPPDDAKLPVATTLLDGAHDEQRQAILRTAIQSSGAECSRVTRTFKQGVHQHSGAVFWNATCLGGRSYVVQVQDDAAGTTRVLECIDLKQLTGLTCFEAFCIVAFVARSQEFRVRHRPSTTLGGPFAHQLAVVGS